MPVDKGGMRYEIAADYLAAPAFADFKADVKAAKAEWSSFKAELKGRAFGTAAAAKELAALAAAARTAARMSAAQAKADREAKVTLNSRAEAIKAYNKVFDKKYRADKAAAVAADRNYVAERRMASAARLRQKVESDLTTVLEKRSRIERYAQGARERNISLTEEERNALKLLSAEEQRLYRLRLAQEKVTTAARPDVMQANAELEAARRRTKVEQELLTQQILAAKGLDKTGKAIPKPEVKGTKDKIRDLLGLSGAAADADTKINRVAFTFRRLFGILAAFTIARRLIDFFRNAIVEAVKFNAVLEQTELGVASVIASVADIRDASGQQAAAVDKLAIAQQEARKQVKLLRVDALSTTASFESLAETFQTALAPGLQAGFDVDQVRKFTREISIAAQAIGLSQDQLAEEIRSVLQGTISKRNTRIATALNITNTDIQNAKLTGTLFDFLSKKFQQFSLSGERAARTLPGLFNRVKDAIQITLGTGTKGFADSLKQTLGKIFDALVQINKETGEITLNKDFVEAVALVSTGLEAWVNEFNRVKSAFSARDTKELGAALGGLLSTLAQVSAVVVEGILKGVQYASRVVAFIVEAVKTAFGFSFWDVNTLKKFLSVLISVKVTFLLLGQGVRGLISLFSFLYGTTRLVLSSLLVGIKGLISTVNLAVAGFKSLRNVIISMGVVTAPTLATFVALAAVLATVALLWAQMTGDLDLSETAISRWNASLIERIRLLNEGLAATVTMNKKRLDEIGYQWAQLDKNLSATSPKSMSDAFSEAFDKISDKLGKMFSKLTGDIGDFKDELAAVQEQGPAGFVLGLSNALAKLGDKMKELEDQARDARIRAETDISSLGLNSGLSQQVSLYRESDVKIADELKQLESDRLQVLRQISNLPLLQGQALQLSGGIEINNEEAKRVALLSQVRELENAIADLKERAARASAAELLSSSARLTFDTQRDLAEQRINAAFAEGIRLAELRNDQRQLDVLNAQQQLRVTRAQQQQAAADRDLDIRQTQALLDITDARARRLAEIAVLERTPEDNAALQEAIQLSDALNEQLATLKEQDAVLNKIADAERRRREEELRFAEAAKDQPIAAGIFKAFDDMSTELSDKFQNTIDIMTSAVKGFSTWAAESIVSAFDPTAQDQSVQERFARFLQGLATQILETLISLSIAAIALNAASGGLLGPLLQGLAKAKGYWQGGEVKGYHEGGRVWSDRHRRRLGFAEGGSPSDQPRHSLPRPAGLHHSDKLPIWVNQDEWIIKKPSVLKAGRDVIDRINQGLFNPMQLRDAVGLRAGQRASVAATISRGFASGGESSRARMAAQAAASESTASVSSVPAIMSPSKEFTERFLRGGTPALLKVLAENGITPNTRRR